MMPNIKEIEKECRVFRDLFQQYHGEMSEQHLKKYFPVGCCQEVTNTLGRYLHNKGYGIWDYVWGEAVICGKWSTHAWLQKDNIICDLTLDQFGHSYPKVYVGDEKKFHFIFDIQDRHPYSLNDLEREVYTIIQSHIDI